HSLIERLSMRMSKVLGVNLQRKREVKENGLVLWMQSPQMKLQKWVIGSMLQPSVLLLQWLRFRPVRLLLNIQLRHLQQIHSTSLPVAPSPITSMILRMYSPRPPLIYFQSAS
ncbi:hypothetical protein C0989_002670, partial [Termitomyces sp. Mn162]